MKNRIGRNFAELSLYFFCGEGWCWESSKRAVFTVVAVLLLFNSFKGVIMKAQFSFKESRLGDQYFILHNNEYSLIEITSIGYVSSSRDNSENVGVEFSLLKGDCELDCLDDDMIIDEEVRIFKDQKEIDLYIEFSRENEIKELEKRLKELKSEKEKKKGK
jgi:hypothetical protein